MNLQEQIGALEMGVDQLIQAAEAPQQAEPATGGPLNGDAHALASASVEVVEPAVDAAVAADEKPTLHIDRPSQNEISMSIGGQTVKLHPVQVGQLIEELSNARASMQPEPPPNLPAGWRFVTTKNPTMAVQKGANGDRLLVLRHTGHGWVPFTFTPDMVIQMYMMLTQK